MRENAFEPSNQSRFITPDSTHKNKIKKTPKAYRINGVYSWWGNQFLLALIWCWTCVCRDMGTGMVVSPVTPFFTLVTGLLSSYHHGRYFAMGNHK
jgi:hypothetical protein